MPTSESQREERHIIASFTGSQPTIHAFRHRQAVPIGTPLVNKNQRPGCTLFSLSSSPPFVSLFSLLSLNCFLSLFFFVCMSPSIYCLHRHRRFIFPIFLPCVDLYSTPRFPFIHVPPRSLSFSVPPSFLLQTKLGIERCLLD